jgi:hypothetical protein
MNYLKVLLFGVLIFTAFLSANDQSYSELISEANSLYDSKDYENSARQFEKAFEIMTGRSGDYYNAACSWALAGNKVNAFRNLNLAIEKGWLYPEHTKTDPDLKSLHDDGEWKTAIELLAQKVAAYEAGLNKELIEELKIIQERDQRYRGAMAEADEDLQDLWASQNELDSMNLVRIKEIIDEYGYPGKSMVGYHSGVAFLVIQHSDLETQEAYFPILKEAADAGEMRWSSLALLIDRIRMGKGQKQLYGSQITQNEQGEYIVYPIEDEANVNKRRAEVGLQPLEEYVKHWDIIYVPKKEEQK